MLSIVFMLSIVSMLSSVYVVYSIYAVHSVYAVCVVHSVYRVSIDIIFMHWMIHRDRADISSICLFSELLAFRAAFALSKEENLKYQLPKAANCYNLIRQTYIAYSGIFLFLWIRTVVFGHGSSSQFLIVVTQHFLSIWNLLTCSGEDNNPRT